MRIDNGIALKSRSANWHTIIFPNDNIGCLACRILGALLIVVEYAILLPCGYG